MAAWLFNPFTFTIGIRRNCEPLVCAIILWIIISLMNGNILQSAFWCGLVHFRIYPIIYALPILLVLEPRLRSPYEPTISERGIKYSDLHFGLEMKTMNPYVILKSLMKSERILFGLISAYVSSNMF